jgi:hypothetical protein
MGCGRRPVEGQGDIHAGEPSGVDEPSVDAPSVANRLRPPPPRDKRAGRLPIRCTREGRCVRTRSRAVD